MPRKECYTCQQIIEALRQAKGMVYLAAENLGCSHQTVYNYINRYWTVKDAWDSENGKVGDIAETKLFDAIEAGEHWAIAFYLGTKGKNRGYTKRQEVDLRVEDLDAAIKSELAKLAAGGEAGVAEGIEEKDG